MCVLILCKRKIRNEEPKYQTYYRKKEWGRLVWHVERDLIRTPKQTSVKDYKGQSTSSSEVLGEISGTQSKTISRR